MIVLVVLILGAAILTGSLSGVLEVAAGVALGLLVFVVSAVGLAYWFVRRKMRNASRELDRFRRNRYV